MTTPHNSAHRRNASVTGFFFITATVTAIVGMKLYDPILVDTDYLNTGIINSFQIVLGAIFESILAISAAGTAIMMYPYLRRSSESWGLGYVCFRLFEVVFILIGLLSMISIVTVNQIYIGPTHSDLDAFRTSANILKAIHDWTFVLGPHFMLGINTMIYSVIFFKSNIVPKSIAMLGITGAVLIFAGAILEMFAIISPIGAEIMVIALPVALYEMILAVWLIVKGFNLEPVIITRDANQ